MFIVLNGPLGIGKSTLAEALSENIDRCAMIEGDALASVNPPPANETEHLHSAIYLLVEHHRKHGCRHFVIEHIWTSRSDLEGLKEELLAIDPEAEICCFLLTLPEAENLERIGRRRIARAIDEREFELETVKEERSALYGTDSVGLGEPFDVSAPPDELVERMLRQIGIS